METGRGDLLTHKSSKHNAPLISDSGSAAATDLVLIQVASFLRRELPIRLAHRSRDLAAVPMMKDMKSVKQVRSWYLQSLNELVNFQQIKTKKGMCGRLAFVVFVQYSSTFRRPEGHAS